ncbi:MAG: 1,4-alpha-glucan branching protein GlgB [Panacagrimonas sp.]
MNLRRLRAVAPPPAPIGAFDLQVFGEGHHWHAYRFLGAHLHDVGGARGVAFSTWAPNAQAIHVVGDFNAWNGSQHAMEMRPGGIWECFVPGVAAGALYKFEIRGADGQTVLKADPYARRFQLRPETASVVEAESAYEWRDAEWLAARRESDWLHAPMSVYEVHAGSWKRHLDGRAYTYRELADALVPYVLEMGFTHIELMPITEHPYDPSWGYQSIGNFAPTSRFGSPDDFRYFVDHCHVSGIGVILDWVPAHFPRDAHGLRQYDGSALYEHADPRRGEHPDWNTLIYDYGRPEVRNYLLSSALFWLEECHIDGLRVDAVASMLYLDYSRKPGEWLPNRHGGRENLEAIEFLRELNHVVHERYPGALMIAEESTSWPQVTRPTYVGGLGFSMKWNMGWMHDTLDYLRADPVFRRYRHDRLSFGQLYAYSENFVLALSHDEVVHGKGSMRRKMHGDDWQRMANLRLLYTYQWSYPGKKLLFMGQEFAQDREWSQDRELDWGLLSQAPHLGMQHLVRELNALVLKTPALFRNDFDGAGFEWIDCHDNEQSVLSFLRRDGDSVALVVLNFTPVVRHGYRIGVPLPGRYVEALNSDSAHFGGSNVGNLGGVLAEAKPWMQREHSVCLSLPPLGGLILVPEESSAA